MNLSDFRIGLEFWCSDRRWRCTDVGSRVVVAIRIDEATITIHDNGKRSTRTMSSAEAEREGLFAGPPYMVVECVFDEHDIDGCELGPQTESAS